HRRQILRWFWTRRGRRQVAHHKRGGGVATGCHGRHASVMRFSTGRHREIVPRDRQGCFLSRFGAVTGLARIGAGEVSLLLLIRIAPAGRLPRLFGLTLLWFLRARGRHGW